MADGPPTRASSHGLVGAAGTVRCTLSHTVLRPGPGRGPRSFPRGLDDDFDRSIVNPTVVNSRCDSVSSSARPLGQGVLLCRMSLQAGEWLSCDDLREFYYTFQVPAARARRNALRVRLPSHRFKAFNAWRPDLVGLDVSPCLNALAMGDNMAVEIANSAHEGLLKSFGALRPSEQAIHRLPFPRSPYVEMLNIDDHTGFQKLSWSGITAPRPDAPDRRDREVFAACDRGYPAVGLVQHPGKKARGATHKIVVGAEVEGRIGAASAPLVRTVALCRLTLVQAYLGRSTKTLLSSLVGCRAQVFLYRGPLLSVFTHVYNFLSSWPDEGEEMWLPCYVRSELRACAYVASVAMTDLRASYSPWLNGAVAPRGRGRGGASSSFARRRHRAVAAG